MENPLRQLEEAERLRLEAKLDKAESICGGLVRRHPYYLAALYTLGLIYFDKGNFEKALDCLTRAQMCDPADWRTLTALALTYLRLGAHAMSIEALQKASDLQPDNASILTSMGEVRRDQREYEAAADLYRAALKIDPNLESAAIGLAICLSSRGLIPEASDVLHTAIRQGHRSLGLLHLVANLPRDLLKVDVLSELDRLADRAAKSTPDRSSSYLFARATALDRAGQYDAAWDLLVKANRMLAQTLQTALAADVKRRENAMKRLRDMPPAMPPSDQPDLPVSLFILGPSRSGKTVLENLLATQPGVKPGCEDPIVEIAVRRTLQNAGLPPATALPEIPKSLLAAFRNNYLDELGRRAGKTKVFTITVAERIEDVAILVSAIPNVRIAVVGRDANDNALRIFMTKYMQGNAYAYSLGSIRNYLAWYNDMSSLVCERFPSVTHALRYETLVAAPSQALADVAGLCDLQVTPVADLSVFNDVECAGNYPQLKEHD